jgi:hypothetical protein
MKDAAVACFKLLSQNLSRGTEKNKENFSKNIRHPGLNWNSVPLRYGVGVVTIRPDLRLNMLSKCILLYE